MRFGLHFLRMLLSNLLILMGMSTAVLSQINPATQIRSPEPTTATPGNSALPVDNPQQTNTQQGPNFAIHSMNASVNSQINVMASPYNAKGDCVTDDEPAIMAAQAAAVAYAANGNTPAALYFPKPPGGCYLTSTIEWQGAPLIGQPNGIASADGGVRIKGKPG